MGHVPGASAESQAGYTIAGDSIALQHAYLGKLDVKSSSRARKEGDDALGEGDLLGGKPVDLGVVSINLGEQRLVLWGGARRGGGIPALAGAVGAGRGWDGGRVRGRDGGGGYGARGLAQGVSGVFVAVSGDFY
jgi:hypothetical protein